MNEVECVVEEIVGNRIGSPVYRNWVAGLGLRGAERVLEIGTGGGACARHLAASLPHGRLTCVEIDWQWLDVARHRLARFAPRVEFVLADAAEWERPGSYDLVVVHFVAHDMDAPTRARVLEKVRRSLHRNGVLCIREPIGHAMALGELHLQLRAAGFSLVDQEVHQRLPLMGDTVSGVWRPASGCHARAGSGLYATGGCW